MRRNKNFSNEYTNHEFSVLRVVQKQAAYFAICPLKISQQSWIDYGTYLTLTGKRVCWVDGFLTKRTFSIEKSLLLYDNWVWMQLKKNNRFPRKELHKNHKLIETLDTVSCRFIISTFNKYGRFANNVWRLRHATMWAIVKRTRHLRVILTQQRVTLLSCSSYPWPYPLSLSLPLAPSRPR